ncbi:unnamed protein product [Cyprideis torosa]|uniref:Ion transport domain-containing protein n=1 Tax=Cyprideis torosa TaxID=163714 RepID=A0A7R8WFX1_9CRUS|nr:unnamed protein product [Cyprideis torosa]CAG0891972.1 unnamed protein product [Cyprideis torosa]
MYRGGWRGLYETVSETYGLPTGTVLMRERWDAWDPMLIAEGSFAAANVFSSLKLVYIFSVNPYLGPLQVSLSRMVLDIMKFLFLYVLVLFSFSCGMNQLLWYYADLEGDNCFHPPEGQRPDPDACIVWRRFANLFETSQTLFWAAFGLIDLQNFELHGIKSFTRFWGLLMFGCYSVISNIVLLNLLIAMMNHSYQLIFDRADTEWKFARSKLWISYFEEGGTVPPPFNIIPTPKSAYYLFRWMFKFLCGKTRAAKKQHMMTIRRQVRHASERDVRYQGIMRNLVRRYVTQQQYRADNQGVTEDDVNEIKQDISSFRCELIEVLKNSGMNTASASGGYAGGKKNRQRERRLMKGFNLGTHPPGKGGVSGGGSTTSEHPFLSTKSKTCAQLTLADELNEEGVPRKSPITKLVQMARMAGARKVASRKRWGTLIDQAVRRQGIRRRDSSDTETAAGEEGASDRRRKFREKRVAQGQGAAAGEGDGAAGNPDPACAVSTEEDSKRGSVDSEGSSLISRLELSSRWQLRRTSSEPGPKIAEALMKLSKMDVTHEDEIQEGSQETSCDTSKATSSDVKYPGLFYVGSERRAHTPVSTVRASLSKEPLVATPVAPPYNRRPNGNSVAFASVVQPSTEKY